MKIHKMDEKKYKKITQKNHFFCIAFVLFILSGVGAAIIAEANVLALNIAVLLILAGSATFAGIGWYMQRRYGDKYITDHEELPQEIPYS